MESDLFIFRLVKVCIPIADHAGTIIRSIMKTGDLDIVDKGSADYQTEADRRAQRFIITTLTREFPKINIIGEEAGNDTCSEDLIDDIQKFECPELNENYPENLKNIDPSRVTVWVDPLDGTREFTEGLINHVTVLIGIAVDDRPVAGVIHQPYYKAIDEHNYEGRTLWGVDGVGAFGFEKKVPPSGKFYITTTRSHNNALIQEAIEALKPDDVIRVGGAGHKAILVLEGEARAYLFSSAGTKRWDTCAPEALIRASGGSLTDIFGNCYPYNKDTYHMNDKGIFASANKDDHDKYLALLPDSLRQSLNKTK